MTPQPPEPPRVERGKPFKLTQHGTGRCSANGKISFRSKEEAMRARGNTGTQKSLEPFRCALCGGWHLGSRGGHRG